MQPAPLYEVHFKQLTIFRVTDKLHKKILLKVCVCVLAFSSSKKSVKVQQISNSTYSR